jgi:hypothetical protein
MCSVVHTDWHSADVEITAREIAEAVETVSNCIDDCSVTDTPPTT